MPSSKRTLGCRIADAGQWSCRVFVGPAESASWGELISERSLSEIGAKLSGRSVLLVTIDPLAALTALIQLDGVARRIVLYPPDMSRDHLAFVAKHAAADLIVTDEAEIESMKWGMECISARSPDSLPKLTHQMSPELPAGWKDPGSAIETEWVLLTSGTTGPPKLVAHTLASLAGAIHHDASATASTVWSTFYDIRRYGGLQIFLRAALTGTSLVLPGWHEPVMDFLSRAGGLGVTHISGTPSHWRRALMSSFADRITPEYVRLSGEIVDRAILNQLGAQYPCARIAHAFASTEAGVAFEVNDGLMGFPAEAINETRNVEMKVERQSLRVRSNRTALAYLGEGSPSLRDTEGFVDTGDLLELRNGRYHFIGRRDGTINVGGWKVHPEEIEMVLNRHPEVSISLVREKKNPIAGTLAIADVVLKSLPQAGRKGAQALQRDILHFCRGELPLYKVPVTINFVSVLAVNDAGKLIRSRA
jgi:acyl-CoA synthetase (AMP-forming)/AMP-acid ligase II